MEKPVKEMHVFLSPGSGLPTPLNPEYSGIGKGQRIPDRCKTAQPDPVIEGTLQKTLHQCQGS